MLRVRRSSLRPVCGPIDVPETKRITFGLVHESGEERGMPNFFDQAVFHRIGQRIKDSIFGGLIALTGFYTSPSEQRAFPLPGFVDFPCDKRIGVLEELGNIL